MRSTIVPETFPSPLRGGSGRGSQTSPMAEDQAASTGTLDLLGQAVDAFRAEGDNRPPGTVLVGALRRALGARDGGCRFPGCDRPPGWTDAHHMEHWADGGATALSNTVLLCRPH